MNISKNLTRIYTIFFAAVVLLFAVQFASAQIDSTPKKRLKNPATVKGFIGGESHDSYQIRVRKNQTLKVQIAWKETGDRTATFVISRSADFFAGDVLEGGTETYSGKIRTVKIPATADYYIYVTAHPTANYTLKVSVK